MNAHIDSIRHSAGLYEYGSYAVITHRQLKALVILFGRILGTDADTRHYAVSVILGREITTFYNLTKAEASALLHHAYPNPNIPISQQIPDQDFIDTVVEAAKEAIHELA